MKKIFWKILLKLGGDDFEKQYKQILKIKNKKDLKKFQEKKLKELLLHSYKNVPYYRKVFQKIGLVKNRQVDLTKFNKIPILTKDIIRKEGRNLFSKDWQKRKTIFNSSGGSTGEPVRFIQDKKMKKWNNATLKYYYQNLVKIDETKVKKIILWGSERDIFKGSLNFKTRVLNWLKNVYFLNSFKMNQKKMLKYIKIINKIKPELIRGYAGSLFELAKFIQNKKKKIYSPKIIVSAAETLREDMRSTIEKVFKAPVYNFYGSREIGAIAGQAKNRSLYNFAFLNLVEILNSKNQPSQEGKIIITNLHNFAMPLIRYEVGDLVVLSPQKKFFLPALSKISGRITDHFIKKTGEIIHGEYFTHLFYLRNWVKSFQVIQKSFDKIKILIVLRNKINLLEKKEIEDKIKLVMGKKCKIEWEFIKNIPKTKSGKFLYTKTLIKK